MERRERGRTSTFYLKHYICINLNSRPFLFFYLPFIILSMFNGTRSEQETWNSCVKTILGLLGKINIYILLFQALFLFTLLSYTIEDSLFNGVVPSTKIDFLASNEYLKKNASTGKHQQ